MTRIITVAGLAAFALLALPNAAPGQNEPSATGSAASSREEAGLSLTLSAQSSGGSLTSPADFELEIRNSSDKKFRVGQVTVEGPRAFEEVRHAAQGLTLRCPSIELAPVELSLVVGRWIWWTHGT